MKALSVLVCLFFVTVAFSQDSTTAPPTKFEIGTYHCTGFLTDPTGNGFYTYTEGALRSVKDDHLFGIFLGVATVDVTFNKYHYTDLEFFLGGNYCGWGKIGSEYAYAFSFSPSLKHFSDYGKDGAGSGDEVWQRDWGTQVNAWVNVSDQLNRPFRNFKINFQYQTAFWSTREGTNVQQGFITDKVNFKAVNRTYYKFQLESAIHKISFGELAKLEPKIVLGFLRDVGSKKSQYEFGAGIGISFTKEGRYYEALNIQYRGRFGKEFTNRLDVIEIGLDPQNLFKLL